ncbi:MAG: SRPBCC family protein [Pseudomonadota bacterium]
MNRRTLLAIGCSLLALPACAAAGTEKKMPEHAEAIAPGTNRDFSFTVSTENPDGVWDLWTRPSTWGQWDRGLKSASMEGSMTFGSVGQIQPLSGPPSPFTVVAFEPKRSYAFETQLVGSVLRVERFFNENRTAFTHRVTFSGPSVLVFAQMLGPGFRRALPPTMQQLKALSEQR